MDLRVTNMLMTLRLFVTNINFRVTIMLSRWMTSCYYFRIHLESTDLKRKFYIICPTTINGGLSDVDYFLVEACRRYPYQNPVLSIPAINRMLMSCTKL